MIQLQLAIKLTQSTAEPDPFTGLKHSLIFRRIAEPHADQSHPAVIHTYIQDVLALAAALHIHPGDFCG